MEIMKIKRIISKLVLASAIGTIGLVTSCNSEDESSIDLGNVDKGNPVDQITFETSYRENKKTYTLSKDMTQQEFIDTMATVPGLNMSYGFEGTIVNKQTEETSFDNREYNILSFMSGKNFAYKCDYSLSSENGIEIKTHSEKATEFRTGRYEFLEGSPYLSKFPNGGEKYKEDEYNQELFFSYSNMQYDGEKSKSYAFDVEAYKYDEDEYQKIDTLLMNQSYDATCYDPTHNSTYSTAYPESNSNFVWAFCCFNLLDLSSNNSNIGIKEALKKYTNISFDLTDKYIILDLKIDVNKYAYDEDSSNIVSINQAYEESHQAGDYSHATLYIRYNVNNLPLGSDSDKLEYNCLIEYATYSMKQKNNNYVDYDERTLHFFMPSEIDTRLNDLYNQIKNKALANALEENKLIISHSKDEQQD